MNEAWDPNHPIQVLFGQIEDAVYYASAVKAVYTTLQIANIVYTLVSETGLFDDEYKKWSKKDPANKLWRISKPTSPKAHQDLQDSHNTGRSTDIRQTRRKRVKRKNQTR